MAAIEKDFVSGTGQTGLHMHVVWPGSILWAAHIKVSILISPQLTMDWSIFIVRLVNLTKSAVLVLSFLMLGRGRATGMWIWTKSPSLEFSIPECHTVDLNTFSTNLQSTRTQLEIVEYSIHFLFYIVHQKNNKILFSQMTTLCELQMI